MAKTRSAKARANPGHTNLYDGEHAENNSIDEEATAEEPTTLSDTTANFKNSLERFHYAQGTTDGSSPKAGDLQSAHNDTRKRPMTGHDNGTALPSPSTAKRRRRQPSSKYAPPSTYAHLPKLNDILAPHLIGIFVGTNPGIRTATAGHAYAHPSNLFWKLLHSSGCTDVRLPPTADVDLPRWYAMGNTNIVERPSKDAAELSKAEMAAGTPVLEEKVRRYRPESVCIVGKGIWEAVWRWRYKREMKKAEFKWGWQDDGERMGRVEEAEAEAEDEEGSGGAWEGARVYVTSSTSGSAASLRPAEKEAIWAPFGEWVKRRRKERFGTEGRIDRPVVSAADDEARLTDLWSMS